MKRFLIILAMAAISASAFAQSKTSIDYKESSARNLEPMHSVMVAPLIADLNVVGDQVTYTEKDAFANYTVDANVVKYIPDFKKVALSRAARAHKADAIIGATVDVVTNASGHLEITITGYPARYTNFRNATSEDIILVQKGLETMAKGAQANMLALPESIIKREVEK